MKRVKTVLDVTAVTRLLGLPGSVRIVGLTAQADPDRISVLIEGDDLSETFSWPGGPSDQEMAAAGLTEAPVVPVDRWARVGS